MAKHKIALLPGDGVGVDVMDAARIVLDKIGLNAEYVHAGIGWKYWCAEGEALPQRTIDILKSTTCALFGAITSKPKDEAERELASGLRGRGLSYRSPIVRLRQMFDLYCNLRPSRAYPGNPLNFRDDIDLVVFRENTEGLYAGVEFRPLPGEVRAALVKHSRAMEPFKDVPGDDIAVSARVITRRGASRIVRRAFEYARTHGHKFVTLVEKPNVLRETSGLMMEAARAIAGDYPGLELRETNIDTQVMDLIRDPKAYGVMVTSNLFGDILSDLCAQLVGGPGFAPSGNLGDGYAVFEPVHGSAPALAGQHKANPMAMLLAVKMMLDWLGEGERAGALEAAIAGVIQEGRMRTPDLGGSNTTLEVAEAVAGQL
jgi:isocitrate/isopropylmalate dehydrogenase